MKRYRNKYTGQIIEINSQITAGPWEEVTASTVPPEQEAKQTDTQDGAEKKSLAELRPIAKEYGINSFGKSAEELSRLIREHEAQKQQSEPAAGTQNAQVAPVQPAEQTTGAVIKARKEG